MTGAHWGHTISVRDVQSKTSRMSADGSGAIVWAIVPPDRLSGSLYVPVRARVLPPGALRRNGGFDGGGVRRASCVA